MSNTRLFDSRGHLLPPEQCNIQPLESLTKDRARSPARRSPSRDGRHSAGSERVPSPQLPNFVQEISQNTKAGNIRLVSPTALKAEYFTEKQHHISTNNVPQEGKYINTRPSNSTSPNFKPSLLSNSKLKGKMESDTEGSNLELLEKPVLNWTSKDVGIWLDHIGLSKLKEHFLSHNVSGQTLFDLSFEMLEELNLSEANEREHFLAEVYNLQQERGQANGEEEQEMDKEIEETLQGASPQENNNDKPVISSNTGSDSTPTHSYASSSRTGSEIGSSPTLEMADDGIQKGKEDSPKSTVPENKSEPSRHTITSNQVSPNKSKSQKDTSKQTSKKSKPKGKRITRLFNSIHQSHKDPSLLHTAPPIYKNAFHNLMNTGPQGVIKIWTEMFLTDMQYVSLLVKHESTAFDVIKMVLEKSNAQEDPECYRICEINEKGKEYILDRNECPLQRERQWSDPDNCTFELRWRNERLIEWVNTAGSVAQGLSKKKIVEEPSRDKHSEQIAQPSSPPSSVSTSDPDSPEADDVTRNDVMETEFTYIVEVDHGKAAAGTKSTEKEDIERRNELASSVKVENGLESIVDDPESLPAAPKRLTSSCPDLSAKDLQDGDPEYGNLLISKNSGFLNAESDLASAGLRDEPTTDLDGTTTVGEFEYSQQLRRSSKRLSERLRFKGKPRVEGEAVEIGINMGNQVGLGTQKDILDDKVLQSGETEGNVGVSVDTSKDTQVGQQDVSDGVPRSEDVPRVSAEEKAQKGPEDENVEGPGGEGKGPTLVLLPAEVREAFARIEELQNDNLLLAEDNRELKKKCRTFEGKSRLKERELEEMEEEKNELANQVHDMVAELHTLRAANTELRTEVDEANTKLSDVDGWVTRDVFEEIRGQLSVSLEEVEKKEEDVREIEKKCKLLEVENKKMKELELEVEKLNDKIKEDSKVHDGMKKDMKEKEKRVHELEVGTEKLQNSLDEMENDKQAAERQLSKVEGKVEEFRKSHGEDKKDFHKRLSDREYEILIMKEEKKELCVKMKGFENNVETLREEMKKKDAEHEAAIAEMEEQSAIKDQSLAVTVSNLEELVNERDMRIKQLKKQLSLSGVSQGELETKEHEYEQNKVYLKHLIALVKKKDPSILDALNKKLSSRDAEDWC